MFFLAGLRNSVRNLRPSKSAYNLRLLRERFRDERCSGG